MTHLRRGRVRARRHARPHRADRGAAEDGGAGGRPDLRVRLRPRDAAAHHRRHGLHHACTLRRRGAPSMTPCPAPPTVALPPRPAVARLTRGLAAAGWAAQPRLPAERPGPQLRASTARPGRRGRAGTPHCCCTPFPSWASAVRVRAGGGGRPAAVGSVSPAGNVLNRVLQGR